MTSRFTFPDDPNLGWVGGDVGIPGTAPGSLAILCDRRGYEMARAVVDLNGRAQFFRGERWWAGGAVGLESILGGPARPVTGPIVPVGGLAVIVNPPQTGWRAAPAPGLGPFTEQKAPLVFRSMHLPAPADGLSHQSVFICGQAWTPKGLQEAQPGPHNNAILYFAASRDHVLKWTGHSGGRPVPSLMRAPAFPSRL